MTLGRISEEIQDRLQRSFNRPIEISPAPKEIGGGLYYINKLKMDGAFKAADLIGQACYAEGLAPCVVALAQLLSADPHYNPAELIISIPPRLDPNAARKDKIHDIPGEAFYPPPPVGVSESDLRIGTEQEYLRIIETHAKQLQLMLSSKRKSREQGA